MGSTAQGRRPGGGLPEKVAVPDYSPGEPPAKATPLYAGNDFVLQLYLRDIACTPAPRPAGTPATAAGSPQPVPCQQLVLDHLSGVVRIAFEYGGFGLPIGDLINEGNLGLLHAARMFDPARNVRFTYYARPWIRVRMQRALSYQAWPVSLPADFGWRHGRVQAAQERLSATLNRDPSDTELAAGCGFDLPTVRRLRRAKAPSFVPLESPCPGNETGLTLEEVIPDESSLAPDQEAMRRSDREFIEGLLGCLKPSEQKVLQLRYGLEGGCARTCEEVGRMLGYGRQGIHRIECAALAKLRRHVQFKKLQECAQSP